MFELLGEGELGEDEGGGKGMGRGPGGHPRPPGSLIVLC